MLKCDVCNGSARKPMGFFSVDCVECDNGYLTVDAIWRNRIIYNGVANEIRLFEWNKKKIKMKLLVNAANIVCSDLANRI